MLRLFLITAFVIVGNNFSAPAQIIFTPPSITLENRDRGGQLSIGNTGDLIGRYSIEPTFIRMEPDGSRTEVSSPFPNGNAAEVIRFSPRQFDLAPGTNQTVRIAKRIPESLPHGEYRIHLKITNEGEAQRHPQIVATGDGATSVAIHVRVSRTVHVIVRHGVEAGRASLTDVTAHAAGGGRLSVSSELTRSGMGSSRGLYRVYTRGNGGAMREEFIRRFVPVYNELPRRTVEDTIPASAIRGGVEICVAYRDEMAADGGEEERCVRPG